MKVRLLLLLALISIAFIACDLNGDSNYTPEIFVSSSHVNKNDTVNLYLTDEGGVVRTDTIHVGDTIVIKIRLNGLSNNLTNFYVTRSDSSLSKILLPMESSMDTIFSKTQSNYSTGNFVFQPKINLIYFPIRYVAVKPTLLAYIQLTLVSDANFKAGYGNNSATLKLKIPTLAKATSVVAK